MPLFANSRAQLALMPGPPPSIRATSLAVSVTSILLVSVVPPRSVRECAQVELVRPRGAVLLREVDIGLRDLRGKHEPVVLVAACLSQLSEPLRSQHLSQRVRRVHRAVDHDVDDVDPLWRDPPVQSLPEQRPPPRGRGG